MLVANQDPPLLLWMGSANHRAQKGREWFPDKFEGLLGRRNGLQNTTAIHYSQLPPALLAVYVGLATVAAATWWFLYDAEGPHVTFYQLVSKDGQGPCWGYS